MLNYNESNFPSPDEARAVQTSPAPNNFLSPVLLNEEGMWKNKENFPKNKGL